MVNILLLMLLACSMTGSYKIVKITQYYDDYGPAPPQDEVRKMIWGTDSDSKAGC